MVYTRSGGYEGLKQVEGSILLGYAKYMGMFGILVRIRDEDIQTLQALASSDDAKGRHIARMRECCSYVCVHPFRATWASSSFRGQKPWTSNPA